MFKILIHSTFQAILIFFSLSFLTVLYCIAPQWTGIREPYDYELHIGFPFEYYERFWLDLESPNHGWNFPNLFYNCVLIWLLTFLWYWIKYQRKSLISE